MMSENTDRVSLVTVCYNAEQVIEKTILSVLEQTYGNIEYIIVDGNSSDNTTRIIKHYEHQVDLWISEDDSGIYNAMNKAIDMAAGDWIVFMNAGDTFCNHSTVSKVMEHINGDSELVYGDHIRNDHYERAEVFEISKGMTFCHQALFAKTALMKAYPFDESYKISADYHFVLRMYLQKRIFQYIPMAIANYADDGVSAQNKFYRDMEMLKALFTENVDMQQIAKSEIFYSVVYRSGVKETTNEDLTLLLKTIDRLVSAPISKHPFRKISAYRRVLNEYDKIRRKIRWDNG